MSNKNLIDLVNSQIAREQLRQACISFYSATVVAAISVSVTLLGAGEILMGNPHGTKMMSVGLPFSVESIRLMRSASDRVKKISD